jgi:hypothetical protein
VPSLEVAELLKIGRSLLLCSPIERPTEDANSVPAPPGTWGTAERLARNFARNPTYS